MITSKKKRKMNPMLLNVLLISGAVHVAALVILGGITIVKFVIPDEAQFEEPPEMVEEVPPPDHKVEIKPQAAPQQQAMQNLRMKQVGNISVNTVDVALPTMEQSFTVSTGMGGFGGSALLGNTRGSIGMGMSDISVFGLKSRAERVLFAIDASRTMLTDEKGGLNSYKVIKDEITDMVGNLSAGTLFNVVLFNDGNFLFFKPNLVPAGSEVTQELAQWIAPINAHIDQLGIRGAKRVPLSAMPDDNIIKQNIPRFQHVSGNVNAYVTQVFLEQSSDAIFIIAARHGGFQGIHRALNEKERADFDRVVQSDRYKKYAQEYSAEQAEARKLAVAKKKAQDEERKKKGIPPRVLDHGNIVHQMGIPTKLGHPYGKFKIWDRRAIGGREVERYFRDVLNVLYKDEGIDPPSVNVVLFLAGDEQFSEPQEDRLKDYTRFFRGKYRIIRGLDEIKRASSAADTKN